MDCGGTNQCLPHIWTCNLTDLIMNTSWANSVSISLFKRSALRTLIATSWLQYVPLYLKKTNDMIILRANIRSDICGERQDSQITKWPRSNFVCEFQQAGIDFPDIRSVSRNLYIFRWGFRWRFDLLTGRKQRRLIWRRIPLHNLYTKYHLQKQKDIAGWLKRTN